MPTLEEIQAQIAAQNRTFDTAVQNLRAHPERQVEVDPADLEEIESAAITQRVFTPSTGLRG